MVLVLHDTTEFSFQREKKQAIGVTCRPYGGRKGQDGRPRLHTVCGHPGYLISQQKRKRIEEIFGWLKTVAGLRKTRHRGAARVGWMFRFARAAYNLVRMRNLLPAAA